MPGWFDGPPPGWHETRKQPLGSNIAREWKDVVFDVQLQSGPRLVAERWGVMKFDFTAGPTWMRTPESQDTPGLGEAVDATMDRLRVLNVHLLFIHGALLDLERRSTGTVRLTHKDLIFISQDGSSVSGPALYQMPIVFGITDIGRNFRVSIEVLTRAAELLDKALEADENVFDQLDLLHLGLATYQQHRYSEALVAAWTVCEQIVARKWGAYIEIRRGKVEHGGQTVERMNSDRRTKLRSSDFSMSAILQILELADELDHSVFRRLDSVRQLRNRWLHRLSKPSSDDAAKALTAASVLFEASTGIPLTLSMGLGITSPI